MARQSRELGFDASNPFTEENLDLWQPSSFLGPFEDPAPVSQTADHQCVHLGDPLRNDSFFEGLPTTAGPGWTASTSTLENDPFTINHDPYEPWLHVPTTSARAIPCYDPQAVEATDPKEQSEPTQPANGSLKPTQSNENRSKKKISSGRQHSSRRDDINRDLRCPYDGCGYDRPFSTKGTLRRHIDTQHENPWAWECPEPACGQLFKRKDGRDVHIRNVHLKEQSHLQDHGS